MYSQKSSDEDGKAGYSGKNSSRLYSRDLNRACSAAATVPIDDKVYGRDIFEDFNIEFGFKLIEMKFDAYLRALVNGTLEKERLRQGLVSNQVFFNLVVGNGITDISFNI